MSFRKNAISQLGIWLIAGLVCGFFPLLAGCQPANQPAQAPKQVDETLTPEAKEHLSQAQKFLAEGKMTEARKEFQETARLMPNSPLVQYWLGKAYFYGKEREPAIKAFQRVLELDPNNYHAMAMLGKIYTFDQDKLDLAEKYLLQALERTPDNLDVHFDLGRIYAMKGERNKSLTEFHTIFSTEADFFLYHYEMGRIFESWGENEKALQEYQQALMLNPNLQQAASAVKRLEGPKAPQATPPGTPPAPRK